jgi:penicillin-binding protein-related factor A (putative recombinase)
MITRTYFMILDREQHEATFGLHEKRFLTYEGRERQIAKTITRRTLREINIANATFTKD